jgi:VCBS repeat-containing protein
MATINGTGGNDTIRTAAAGGSLGGLPNATDTGDTINGLAGNDLIIGGAGNDLIDGGAGRDTIRGGGGNDQLYTGDIIVEDENLFGEAGDDLLIGGSNPNAFFAYLTGGPGNDTIQVLGTAENDSRTMASYTDRSLPITANLVAQTVTIDLGSGVIETDTLINVRGVQGGTGNDSFIGSSRNEVFLPGLGANLVNGGTGSDSVRYYDLDAGVTVDLAAGTATHLGDGSVDSLIGIEQVIGTNFADTLQGDGLDNDFRPLAGNDVVDGRGGYDTLQYGASAGSFTITRGVTVNLATGQAVDPWLNTDTLTSIEMVIGTTGFADDLTGVAIADGTRSQLRGLGGNDTLRGTGNDTSITADYRADGGAVRVNLGSTDATLGGTLVAAGTARDGFGGTDTLIGIRSVRGSASGDFIQGGAASDRLEGEGGNDEVRGGAGNDAVRGNAGNDALFGENGDDGIRGGAGTDTYSGGDGYDNLRFDGDTPTQGAVASLTTGLITDQFGNAETIGAVNDFEMLVGSTLGDDLEGKSIPGNIAQLEGEAGNDTLRAGSGSSAQVVAYYAFDPDANNDGFGITADLTLATQQVTDGYGDRDTLVGVGGIRGTRFKDLITGNDADNWFRGEGGDDVIDGRGGFDILSYTGFASNGTQTSGVTAALANGAGSIIDGLGGTDTVTGIEQVNGSQLADSITISGSQAMRLLGNGGDDVITGGDGDDHIDGGLGLDTANGGGGNDTIVVSDGTLSEVYSGGTGQDRFLIGATLAADYLSVVADIVTDFAAGAAGDSVDLTNVIDILVGTTEIAAGDNPFATGNLRIVAGSAILQVDWDGADGVLGFTDLLVMQGATPAELVAANFGGFDPLTVLPNAPPVASADMFDGPEDAAITGNVLDNDSDIDSTTLTALLVSFPTHGALALNADGSFTYTPEANFNGTDSFTYRANDGLADSATVTATLTVDPVNDAPVALPDAFESAFGAPFVVGGPGVLANDLDVEGDVLTAELVSGPAEGVLVLNPDGSFTYTPASFFFTPQSFTYRVNDGPAASAPVTVTLTGMFVDPGPGSPPTYGFSQGYPGTPPANQAPPPASAADIAAFVRTGSTTLEGTTYSLVENIGAWNAIKNVTLASFDPAFSTAYAIANFVSVDADFSAAGSTGLDLLVAGAKRSAITTADGADDITLLLHSNGWGGNDNLLRSGGGNDTVFVTGVGNSTLDNALLADNPSPANGALWRPGFTGGFDTAVTVEAGAGDDSVTVAGSIAARLFGGAGMDTLTGGAGRDLIDGGADADVLAGGAGRDTFLLRAGQAAGDAIADFAAGDVIRLVGFGAGTSLGSLGGGQFQVGTETFTVSGATTLVAGVDYIFA